MQYIVLENLPKVSTNKIYAGMHWKARKTLKDQFLWLTLNAMKKMTPQAGKVDLEFVFYFKSRPLDSSNCAFAAKMLEDCLVHHGVLKGDSIDYVRKISYQSCIGKYDFCEIFVHPLLQSDFHQPAVGPSELIALLLQDMFGGFIGVRHPFDRAVIIFDIILPGKDGKEGSMLELELSHKEINEGSWREKADLLKSALSDNKIGEN